MPGSCQHCGAQLALGAVACFRCGRLVGRADEGGTGAGGELARTQLGTVARAELLETQWRLVKVLGQGAVGQVWQAHDIALDRPVAVKLMHEPLAADPAQVARFEREARLLAGVDHPGLLPVLGVGRLEGRPFIVTHLLKGKTLAEHLHQRGGSLDPREAARVLVPICDALDCLHAAKVVHRDLKPSNIFLGDDQQVTLLDLGSAFESGSELTRTAPLLFESPYLSPEQRARAAQLDGKSDVYSLGCLLLEVLTPAAAPIELAQLARRAMEPSPAARPTASEFQAILSLFLPAALPVAAPAVPAEKPSPAQTAVDLAPVTQKLAPMWDEPTSGSAPTRLRPALRHRRLTPGQLKAVVGAGLLAALLAVLFAPGPQPAPLPAPSPMERLAFVPVIADPEPPRATADLIERKDELLKRADQAAEERPGPGKHPLPRIVRQVTQYASTAGFGELQIEVTVDGKKVSANLTVDDLLLGPSPVYLPLKAREYQIGVERRPFPATRFPIRVVANQTVRLQVELRPLQDAL